MGRAIAAAATDAGLSIAGGTDRTADGEITPGVAMSDDPLALAARSDILIDFSAPAALSAHLEACITAHKPILVGTTGLEATHHALIDEAAANIPVLQTGNTSLGVNLLAALVEQAAAGLGEDWDIEIVEMHHRHKVDAPSGTALALGRAVAKGRGVDLEEVSQRARDGITGERRRGDIGFAVLRGGDVVGNHSVILAGGNDRLELTHQATSRQIFAAGAVRAAMWLQRQPPGLYGMRDMLGFAG